MPPLGSRERSEGADPEAPADHGRVLEQRFLLGVEQIETGGDQALDGLRQLPREPAISQHPRELLRIEWVSTRPGEQLDLRLRRQN